MTYHEVFNYQKIWISFHSSHSYHIWKRIFLDKMKRDNYDTSKINNLRYIKAIEYVHVILKYL